MQKADGGLPCITAARLRSCSSTTWNYSVVRGPPTSRKVSPRRLATTSRGCARANRGQARRSAEQKNQGLLDDPCSSSWPLPPACISSRKHCTSNVPTSSPHRHPLASQSRIFKRRSRCTMASPSCRQSRTLACTSSCTCPRPPLQWTSMCSNLAGKLQ